MQGIAVGPRCSARTIHLAIDLNGAAWRDGWWISTVSRLFAALPGAEDITVQLPEAEGPPGDGTHSDRAWAVEALRGER